MLDWVVIVLATLGGVVALRESRLSGRAFSILAPLYFLATLGWLLLFSLMFVCRVFEDCL